MTNKSLWIVSSFSHLFFTCFLLWGNVSLYGKLSFTFWQKIENHTTFTGWPWWLIYKKTVSIWKRKENVRWYELQTLMTKVYHDKNVFLGFKISFEVPKLINRKLMSKEKTDLWQKLAWKTLTFKRHILLWTETSFLFTIFPHHTETLKETNNECRHLGPRQSNSTTGTNHLWFHISSIQQ